MSLTSAAQTLASPDWTSFTLNVQSINGYGQPVQITCSGLPTETVCPFNVPLSSGANYFQLQMQNAANGTYTFAFMGTSGGLVRTASAQLTVTSGTFTGSVSRTSATIPVGRSKNFTVQVDSKSGFQGQVNLTCYAASGLTCQLTPAQVSVSTGGSATATLSIGVTTEPGFVPTDVWTIFRGQRRRPPLIYFLLCLFVLFAVWIRASRRGQNSTAARRPACAAALTVLLLLTLGIASCGGGGDGGGGTGGGGAGGGGSGGTITLGQQTNNGGDGSLGANIPAFVPVLLPNGSGNYTLSAAHWNVDTTGSGHFLVGIYGSTTSNCPTNQSICANTSTLLCSSPTHTATVGDNVVTPTGCGTLTNQQYYWLAAEPDTSGLQFGMQNPSYCGATGMSFNIGATQGGFALPTTAAQVSSIYQGCEEFYAVFTCVSGCGSVTPPYGPLLDFSGQTNGTALSAANLAASSVAHCQTGGTWDGTFSSAMEYSTAQSQNFQTAHETCGVSIAGNTGLVVDADETTGDFFRWNYATAEQGATGQSYGFYWYTNETAVTNGDLCDVAEIGGGDALTWGLHKDSTNGLYMSIERTPTTIYYGAVPVSANTWYWLTCLNNEGAAHRCQVQAVGSSTPLTDNGYTGTGTLMNNIAFVTTGSYPQTVSFGSGVGSYNARCGHSYFSNITIDPTGATYPIPQ